MTRAARPCEETASGGGLEDAPEGAQTFALAGLMGREAQAAEERKMLSRSALLARGWTDGLIRRFLGEPDAHARNPYYRSGTPMRLYAIERVEAAERDPDWVAAAEKVASQRQARAAARAASLARQRERLLSEVEKLRPEVAAVLAKLDPKCVEREAIRAWKEIQQSRRDEGRSASSYHEPPDTLRAICNYLRHEVLAYDAWWPRLRGKVGADEAHQALRDMIEEEWVRYTERRLGLESGRPDSAGDVRER